MLAFAQQQLGAKTKRDTINRALTIAAAGQRGRPGPGTAVAPGERRRVPRLRRSRRTGVLRAVTYLADTSAVWRLLRRQIGTPWPDRVARGLVAICPPVEAELMPGLRADRDYEPFFTMLGQTFGWVPALDAPWPKIIAVQRDLVGIGHHRGPSPVGRSVPAAVPAQRAALLAGPRHLVAVRGPVPLRALRAPRRALELPARAGEIPARPQLPAARAVAGRLRRTPPPPPGPDTVAGAPPGGHHEYPGRSRT
ncbi:hypothetical protein PV750_08415 [Streptomyces europaeiscabiei]|nr:hypothetical protein [Streptomyces europaeiscabiei]MDX3841505.1 hypothetical protein [Streptomyces europaeiscabiei]